MSEPEQWRADTIRLARRLPEAVAPGILADRYLERLGWSAQADAAVSWVVFDGPSAVGKDTQIDLVTSTLHDRGLTVTVVGGTGAGTALGPLVASVIEQNARRPGPSRWVADHRLKAGAWDALRQHLPVRGSAELVLCNRGPLSQLVYSAISGAPDLLDTGRGMLQTAVRATDTCLLLSCPDDVVTARARQRAASGEKPLRVLDTPEFISAANRAYHDLAAELAWVRPIDVTGDKAQNLAAIMQVLATVLPDSGPGNEDAS